MRPQDPEALRTWIEFFEEHVTLDGGPLEMTVTWESEQPWRLVCNRNEGTYVEAAGERMDVETLLKEHA